MKKKIMKLKIEAEKLENLKAVKAGSVFCCHDPGEGCDCTSNPNRFETKFEAWMIKLESLENM